MQPIILEIINLTEKVLESVPFLDVLNELDKSYEFDVTSKMGAVSLTHIRFAIFKNLYLLGRIQIESSIKNEQFDRKIEVTHSNIFGTAASSTVRVIANEKHVQKNIGVLELGSNGTKKIKLGTNAMTMRINKLLFNETLLIYLFLQQVQ